MIAPECGSRLQQDYGYGFSGQKAAVGVIRTPHQRAGFDMRESHCDARPAEFRELLHGHVAKDRQDVLPRAADTVPASEYRRCAHADRASRESTSAFVSPKPSIKPDFVGMFGRSCFA